MTIRWPNLRDLSVGDVLVGIALLTLIATLAYPNLKARAFRGLLDGAVADVESLNAAAIRIHGVSGSWPAPTVTGAMPPEVAGAFPGDTALVRKGYALQWRRWEVVDQIVGPPEPRGPEDADAPPDSVGPRLLSVARPIGGIVVHSGRSELLAELLSRYGAEVSFVRDTMWTLVVDLSDGRTP